jgi:hypothetical protein
MYWPERSFLAAAAWSRFANLANVANTEPACVNEQKLPVKHTQKKRSKNILDKICSEKSMTIFIEPDLEKHMFSNK